MPEVKGIDALMDTAKRMAPTLDKWEQIELVALLTQASGDKWTTVAERLGVKA